MKLPGNSSTDMQKSDYIRFFENLPEDLNPESCWIWKGTKNQDGRGRFQLRKKKWLASRLSWCILYGDLPEFIFLLHSCDRPECVNPFHLSPGNNSQNAIEARQRGQQITKLSYEGAVFIKNSDLSLTQLSLLFNVSLTTIRAIKQEKIWNF